MTQISGLKLIEVTGSCVVWQACSSFMNNQKICLQALLASGKLYEQSRIKSTYMLVVKASGREQAVRKPRGIVGRRGTGDGRF